MIFKWILKNYVMLNILSAILTDFISHVFLLDFESVKDFLPIGICGGCSNRVIRFMSKTEGNPEKLYKILNLWGVHDLFI